MDAIKKALKYPLEKLYAFGVFALDAKSTTWPGVSRFSIYLLFPALFLNLVQITLTTALVIMLGRLSEEASGCHPNNSITDTSPRPITYADIRTNDALTIGLETSRLVRYMALLNPYFAFVALTSALLSHLSRSGVPNRTAATQAFLLLIALTASAAVFAELGVDAAHVVTDANWCWVDHAEMDLLSGKKAMRQSVYSGICAVLPVEVALALLYLLCAVHAARLNSVRARAQADAEGSRDNDVALQVLPRGSDVDAEAALDSDARRNPFEDPANVLDTAVILDAAATTDHTQSGHLSDPFSDAHAAKDEEVKSSASVDRETEDDGDPFKDVVASELSPAPALDGTEAASGAVKSTRLAGCISIDTVVEEGWELRSGAVDELSVIAEVDSKDECGA